MDMKEEKADAKAGEKPSDKAIPDAHLDDIGALNGDAIIAIPVIADAKDIAGSSARPGVGPLLDIRAAVKEADTKAGSFCQLLEWSLILP